MQLHSVELYDLCKKKKMTPAAINKEKKTCTMSGGEFVFFLSICELDQYLCYKLHISSWKIGETSDCVLLTAVT